MKHTTRQGRIAAVGCLAALAACQNAPLQGPPELKLGRSECRECGMLISEDRCSSGLLVEIEGRREHLLFDDIGCMLDSLHNDGQARVLDAYVHDHATRAWVNASIAHFVLSDPARVPTPMGSGIVAFANQQDAELAQQDIGGKLHSYTTLGPARRAWMRERYGPEGDEKE